MQTLHVPLLMHPHNVTARPGCLMLQERLACLIEERKKLVDGLDGSGGKGGGGATATSRHGVDEPLSPADTSAMIEKEKHKLEVLKRRQERDIQQACDL